MGTGQESSWCVGIGGLYITCLVVRDCIGKALQEDLFHLFRMVRMVPKLRLGIPVREALLREPEGKALDGQMSIGKQSFPGIHSQAELGSDTNLDLLDQKRLELELCLNPSEKDHRALMTLIRVGYGRDVSYLDNDILKKLELDKEYDIYERPLCTERKKILISRIMRLSHLLLKREWERVKNAR